MVGMVAADTPAAMDLAFPPANVMASNTCTMPVTVPSNPRSGSREMNVLIRVMFALSRPLTSEISLSLIICAFQEVRSGRLSHLESAFPTSFLCSVLMNQMRSNINAHMQKVAAAMSHSTSPPASMYC